MTLTRFKAHEKGCLNSDMQAAWQRDGFLLLEDFVSTEACDILRRRADELVAGFDPKSVRTVFSTTNRSHVGQKYFEESGDKIRFFLEEEAVNEEGDLIRDKMQAVNKMGHAMHDLDPVFEAFSHGPKLANLAADLGLADPKVLQSMYIFKQPGIGGEVVWHQDATFFYTTPQSVIGFWFALEDADRDNGCLFAQPGGHTSPLRAHFHRVDGALKTEWLDDTPWPDTDKEGVPLEVKQGSLVVLHGLLPHYSGPNRSPRSRHAYTLHAVDSQLPYPADNWLQRDDTFPVRGFD